MKALPAAGALALLVVAIAAGGIALLYFHRPGLREYAEHHIVAPPRGAAALTATWFGTTALLLSDGEHALMIDPFFTRPPGLLNHAINAEIAPDEALIAA